MKIKPYIGVPNLGTIRTSTVRFLLARATEGYSVDTNIRVGHDIARNLIAQNFLKSDCTHLWWIDSDITIGNEIDFVDMFKKDRDIIAGAYPIRPRYNKGLTFCYKAKDGGDEIGDLLELDGVGLGCCIIKRKVVEDIVREHGNFCETILNADGLSCQSEDITFCERAKKLGYKIWLHKRVICGHEKTYELLNAYKDQDKLKQK